MKKKQTGKKPARSRAARPARRSAWSRMGIKGKMMISLISMLVAVLLVSGLLLLTNAKKEISRLTDLDVANQARTVELTAESYFKGFYSGLDILGKSPVLRHAMEEAEQTGPRYRFQTGSDYGALVEAMQDAKESLPQGFQDIFVACKTNGQLLRSDGSYTDKTFSLKRMNWWTQLVANEGRPIVSSAYEDENGQVVLTVASSIRREDRIVGAVGVTMNLDQMAALLADFRVGETGFVVVMDAFNKIIYHPDPAMMLLQINDTDYDKNLKEIVVDNKDAMSFSYHRGNQEFHGTTYYIPSIDWQVLGTMPIGDFNAHVNSMALMILLCFVLTAALLAGGIWFSVGSMVRPIRKLQGVADRLAQGQLDVAVDTDRGDEIGDLGRSISRIVERLKTYIVYIDEVAAVLNKIGQRDLVYTLEQDYVGEFSKLKTALLEIRTALTSSMKTISEAASQVDGDARNMASGAQALALGAESQTDAVDKLAQSVQQLNRQAGEEADRARTTSRGVEEIGASIAESNRQMGEMLQAMNGISGQAKEIAKIVSTVEEIAFQTKILALNAAVEAARAGAAGKGFAVVAEEVQNLAGRSSEAAQSVTELIGTTLEAVDNGARIAHVTAESMNQVADHVDQVVQAVDRIADQYQVETHQLGEISQGIDQISSVVQTNSATAEEGAATAEELTVQAAKVRELVSSFHLEEDLESPEEEL